MDGKTLKGVTPSGILVEPAVRFSRVLIVVTVAVLAVLTAMECFFVGGGLTMEEALEISKSTPVVHKALSEVNDMLVEVDYWSADYIRNEKAKNSDELTLRLPDNHGVWRVHWINETPGYRIVHFVDELTGQIIYGEVFFAG